MDKGIAACCFAAACKPWSIKPIGAVAGSCLSTNRRVGLPDGPSSPFPAFAQSSLSSHVVALMDVDQDVTGLMLQCAEGATTEVLVVLINPLPLRTHTKVTVVAGGTTTLYGLDEHSGEHASRHFETYSFP